MTALTAERLRELLRYDPETGLFYWRERWVRPEFERTDKGWNSRHAGKAAGCINPSDGYLQIYVDSVRYTAHRLAFLFQNGEWPSEHVDHINGARTDNRWSNLRECSVKENNRNMKCPSHNTSGLKGAYWHKAAGKWFAKIQVDRKSISLGLHETKELAHAAYCAAAIRYHGEFARFQ